MGNWKEWVGLGRACFLDKWGCGFRGGGGGGGANGWAGVHLSWN